MSQSFHTAVCAYVLQLINQVLAATNPHHLLPRYISHHDRQLAVGPVQFNRDDGRLFLVSVGKAAIPMAQAAADIVGDLITAGVAVSKQGIDHSQLSIKNWQLVEGDHPVSGPKSVQATTAVADLLSQTRANDLVLCLLSGGASALLTQPRLPLADWQALSRALLASGCTINEFNTVRRQLDAIKGGGLARLAAPAPVISLILSDVIGNDLVAIGSGPTVLVDETPQKALAVLERYDIASVVGTAVYHHIHTALTDNRTRSGQAATLPPPTNLIIGSVTDAAAAARQSATASGFTATILTDHLEGEASEVGKFAAAIAKNLAPGHCAILGGETTVTLRGAGIGGRNLELALAAAIALDGWQDIAIATFATDGDDGPTGAAGAIVTGQTVAYGRALQLNARQFLNNNDSYTFFKTLDDAGHGPHLLITGATGTNVNDLVFIIRDS